MLTIELKNVTKEINGQTLFTIDQLQVNEGDRIGLVGKNGHGKSTLLRMMTGQDDHYTGHLRVHAAWDYVPQLKPRTTQSGGEQTLAEINRALSSHRSLLFLDEPTANLDTQRVQQLLERLQTYPGTLIVVSHDRAFLDQLVTSIWAIDQGQIQAYVGNYSNYQRIKDQERHQQQVAYQNYQRKVQQLEREARHRLEHAKHFKDKKKNMSSSEYKARAFGGKYDAHEKAIAKSGKALQKRIDQLDKVDAPLKEQSFVFKEVGHLSDRQQTLIHLRANQVQVEGRTLFQLDDLKIQSGEKISINGPNQSGKTTLLKHVLNQQLEGYYSPDLAIGYFAQNFDTLDNQKTILANVRQDSLQPEVVIRNVLASLGFNLERTDQLAGTLSGGERIRLSFAKLFLGDYNLLFLDEPTNYLDISSLEQVEQFVQAYPGAILLVSHDQAFVEATCNQHYYIEGGYLKTPTYLKRYQDQAQQDRMLLQFQLDQLLMDPEASLDDIRQLRHQLDQLES